MKNDIKTLKSEITEFFAGINNLDDIISFTTIKGEDQKQEVKNILKDAEEKWNAVEVDADGPNKEQDAALNQILFLAARDIVNIAEKSQTVTISNISYKKVGYGHYEWSCFIDFDHLVKTVSTDSQFVDEWNRDDEGRDELFHQAIEIILKKQEGINNFEILERADYNFKVKIN